MGIKVYFTLILSFFCLHSYSQMRIDAGEDLYLCDSIGTAVLSPLSKNRESLILGGSPTALGGKPPYKYKWEFMYKTRLSSKPYIYASDILDDTTKANPKINLNYLLPNIRYKLFLTVVDSLGNSVNDSLIYASSQFLYSDGVIYLYKKKLDTIRLGGANIGSGIPPIKTYYLPNTYVDSINLTSWTPVDVLYKVFIIDSLGCKSFENDWISIKITTNSIHNIYGESFFHNFHNLIKENSFFEFTDKNKTYGIKIYNQGGQLIFHKELRQKIQIGSILSEKGVYFILVDDKSYKIIKE